jgi:tetratricopeptide (TPR) repeat protein
MRLIRVALLTLAAAAPLAAQQPSPELLRVDSLVLALNVSAAVTAIETEARRTPRDFQMLWRLSRVRLLQGDAALPQSRQQDRFYRQAMDIADQAIKVNPSSPDGYVRRAAAAGKVALFAGVLDASDFVLQAKEDVEKVIAMPNVPPITLATAHYILGRTHLKLTETPRPMRMPIGLGFGNLNDALTNLRRARQLRPGFIMIELELARALVANDQAAEARPLLTAIAAMPLTEPGDDTRKTEAAELLKTLR